MDFNVRSDSIDVEQIMEQIRSRIREKRGVDYTEQQLRELAAVKLEKFLDPRGVRSDLLEQFRQHQPRYDPPIVTSFAFEDTTMFETHRGALRFIRKLLSPILKLFFNPNALIHALHAQSEINKQNLDREMTRENQRRDMDALYYDAREPAARHGCPVLRGHSQPGLRTDTHRHRGQEPENARRIARKPARVQRTACARARERGRLQAVGRRPGSAAGCAAERTASQKRRDQPGGAGRDTGAAAHSVAAGRTTR